jgi:hypothetical protein
LLNLSLQIYLEAIVSDDGTADILQKNSSGGVIDWIKKNGMYSDCNTLGNVSGYTVSKT